MDTLSPRERQIAGLVAQGARNPDIAEVLGLTPRTITNSLSVIYRVCHLGHGLDQRVLLANLVAEERARERAGGEEGGYG